MDLLAHISAPTSKLDDDRYLLEAVAYIDFSLERKHDVITHHPRIYIHQPTSPTKISNQAQIHSPTQLTMLPSTSPFTEVPTKTRTHFSVEQTEAGNEDEPSVSKSINKSGKLSRTQNNSLVPSISLRALRSHNGTRGLCEQAEEDDEAVTDVQAPCTVDMIGTNPDLADVEKPPFDEEAASREIGARIRSMWMNAFSDAPIFRELARESERPCLPLPAIEGSRPGDIDCISTVVDHQWLSQGQRSASDMQESLAEEPISSMLPESYGLSKSDATQSSKEDPGEAGNPGHKGKRKMSASLWDAEYTRLRALREGKGRGLSGHDGPGFQRTGAGPKLKKRKHGQKYLTVFDAEVSSTPPASSNCHNMNRHRIETPAIPASKARFNQEPSNPLLEKLKALPRQIFPPDIVPPSSPFGGSWPQSSPSSSMAPPAQTLAQLSHNGIPKITEILKQFPAICQPFYSCKLARSVLPGERGFWIFSIKHWPQEFQLKFITELADYISRNLAGQDPWAEIVWEPSAGPRQVRAYCSGSLVREVYVFLYVLSEKRLRRQEAVWQDWEGNAIVTMNPVERVHT